MAVYTINIKLISSTLIGSGSGFGANIDADVILDECGIPYLPAKRVKGCLRDSALEILDMFKEANISENKEIFSKENLDFVFGTPGKKQPAPVYFHDLTISSEDKQWLQYFMNKFHAIISQDTITDALTELRRQTAIEEETGVADPHSLRTIRVVQKDKEFFGKIEISEQITEEEKNIVEKVLEYACKNLKHLGTKRNRGFGYVECKLLDSNQKDMTANVLERLEKICKD